MSEAKQLPEILQFLDSAVNRFRDGLFLWIFYLSSFAVKPFSHIPYGFFPTLLIYLWTSGNLFIFRICQKIGEFKYLWLHSIHEMCTASAQALVSSMPFANAPFFYWGSTLLHQLCLTSWYWEPKMYIKICNSQHALSQGSDSGGGNSDGALVLLLFLTQPKPKKLYL